MHAPFSPLEQLHTDVTGISECSLDCGWITMVSHGTAVLYTSSLQAVTSFQVQCPTFSQIMTYALTSEFKLNDGREFEAVKMPV